MTLLYCVDMNEPLNLIGYILSRIMMIIGFIATWKYINKKYD